MFLNCKKVNSSAAIDKGTVDILGIGDIQIKINTSTVMKNLRLCDVYYVLDINRNLISIQC